MTQGDTSRTVASEAATPERAIIEKMAACNPVYQHLGLQVLSAGPGHARFAMRVRPELTNTFGLGHGGIVFTLADMAFGFTCNASGERALTASAAIDYLAPAPVDAVLIADAREVARQGRNAFYDVVISVEGGEPIAIVRGRMKVIGGPVP